MRNGWRDTELSNSEISGTFHTLSPATLGTSIIICILGAKPEAQGR